MYSIAHRNANKKGANMPSVKKLIFQLKSQFQMASAFKPGREFGYCDGTIFLGSLPLNIEKGSEAEAVRSQILNAGYSIECIDPLTFIASPFAK